MPKEILTQERVKNKLNYCPITGNLTWMKNNKIAGCKTCGNTEKYYYRIRINDGLYMAHRLIWLYVYGEWPKNQIDHINHDSMDNRISNLREVTNQQNAKNRKRTKNKLGIMGVLLMDNGKYRVEICINGKGLHLGYFRDFYEACCARKSAESKYGFHKNHGVNILLGRTA